MRSAAILLLLTGTALAKPKPPKAHVDCTSGGAAVKPGVPAKLDRELSCTIHVDSLGDFAAKSLTGNMTINLATTTTGLATEARFGPLADDAFKLARPWLVDKDFRACEGFTINATLDDADHPGMDSTVWSMKYKVAPSCPKPKKVAAKLSCVWTAGDGAVFKWPGNGATKHPRVDSEMVCSVNAGKLEAGVVHAVSIGVTGKVPKRGAFKVADDKAAFDATLDTGDFNACANFSVSADVTANGATLWSDKIAFKQSCN